jgi:hypothetical protein
MPRRRRGASSLSVRKVREITMGAGFFPSVYAIHAPRTSCPNRPRVCSHSGEHLGTGAARKSVEVA